MKFQVPSTISKIITMADKSLRLQVDTQELSQQEMAMVFNLYDSLGVFIFSETDIKETDLIDLPEVKVDKEEKTPSQRLRNRLYVYYSQAINKGDFDSWYKKEMNRIGEHYLNKL